MFLFQPSISHQGFDRCTDVPAVVLLTRLPDPFAQVHAAGSPVVVLAQLMFPSGIARGPGQGLQSSPKHTQSIFFVASFPLPFYVLTKRIHVAFVQAVVGPLPVPHVLFLNLMPSNLVLCVHVQIPRGQPVLQGVRRHRRHPPLEGGLRRDG